MQSFKIGESSNRAESDEDLEFSDNIGEGGAQPHETEQSQGASAVTRRET